MSSSKPILQVEFRVSLVNRTQHTVCVYKMENDQSRDDLLKLLQPIIQKNRKVIFIFLFVELLF